MALRADIRAAAEQFQKRWNSLTAGYDKLALDWSWPSIAVVDLILGDLRGRAELTPVDRRLLGDVSCYLSVILHDGWERWGVTSVVFREADEILVRVENGPKITSESDVSFRWQELLSSVVINPPNPFPILNGFELLLGDGQGVVSRLMLGLLTGLSPFLDGPWQNESVESFAAEIEKIERELAAQSAKHYQRLFPRESLGQVAELYLHDLIFPPDGLEEPLPGKQGALSVAKYLKEMGASAKHFQTLATNLAQVADEQISAVGLILAAATIPRPTIQLSAIVETRGSFCGLLRPAVVEVRSSMEGYSDWLLENVFSAHHAEELERDRAYGLLPWVIMGRTSLEASREEPRVYPILRALQQFDASEARSLLDQLCEERPQLLEMRLQRLYLKFIQGEFEDSAREFTNLVSEPGAEALPRLFSLWGVSDLAQGDVEGGIRRLERALSLTSRVDPFYPEVVNDLAWGLFLNQSVDARERAANLITEVLSKVRSPLTARLNLMVILGTLERRDESAKLLNECLELNPYDPRVLTAFLMRKASCQ